MYPTIDSGDIHNLALKNNGIDVAWGYHAYGQTNVPGNLTDVIAITGRGYRSLALQSDGTIVTWGQNGVLGQGDVQVNKSSLL